MAMAAASVHNPVEMIYRRRRPHSSAPGGFMQVQSVNRRAVFGFTDGDYVRLRDEYGTIWTGTAERQADNSVRYRFRDDQGNNIAGMSDSTGVVLRDERGNCWRGFLD
jgi:hypothetical protein